MELYFTTRMNGVYRSMNKRKRKFFDKVLMNSLVKYLGENNEQINWFCFISHSYLMYGSFIDNKIMLYNLVKE